MLIDLLSYLIMQTYQLDSPFIAHTIKHLNCDEPLLVQDNTLVSRLGLIFHLTVVSSVVSYRVFSSWSYSEPTKTSSAGLRKQRGL